MGYRDQRERQYFTWVNSASASMITMRQEENNLISDLGKAAEDECETPHQHQASTLDRISQPTLNATLPPPTNAVQKVVTSSASKIPYRARVGTVAVVPVRSQMAKHMPAYPPLFPRRRVTALVLTSSMILFSTVSWWHSLSDLSVVSQRRCWTRRKVRHLLDGPSLAHRVASA